MKYTLDVSGRDNAGQAAIDRFGGLFISVEDAIAHGKIEAARGRFVFTPDAIWVRDPEGALVHKTNVT